MTKRSGGIGKSNRFLRAADGAITIEFVVMFPLIIAALAFAFELGRVIIAHHTVVNNVRSAVRYLSRSDLSDARIEQARQIVRTGKPSGGAEPAWMSGATVTVTPAQSTFSDADFRVSGQVSRIQASVPVPLLIFSFLGNDSASIPITIVEDMRHIGD